MLKLGNTYEEVRQTAPTAVFIYVDNLCKSINEDQACGAPIGFNFSDELGGPFMLVESYEDLHKVYTPIESKLPKDEQQEECGGWASVIETASSFDLCDWIDPDKTYLGICLCTNDSGGTTFFIPDEIVKDCPNLSESIRLTTEAWNVN